MIKAVVFDLVGVLLKERKVKLSEEEMLLESGFGPVLSDEEYYEWASTRTGLARDKVERISEKLITKLYELKDKEALDRIKHQFPSIKLAIASDHITKVKAILDKRVFSCILISADFGFSKSDDRFYEALISRLHLKPEEILFIDDNGEYVNVSKRHGINSVRFKPHDHLYNVVISNILD